MSFLRFRPDLRSTPPRGVGANPGRGGLVSRRDRKFWLRADGGATFGSWVGEAEKSQVALAGRVAGLTNALRPNSGGLSAPATSFPPDASLRPWASASSP